MLRIAVACAIGLALTGPVLAGTDEDFELATRLFGAVTAEPVVDGIDGKWLPLSTLANLQGTRPATGLAGSYLARFCTSEPTRTLTVARQGQSAFTIEQPSRANQKLTYRFDWIGGSQFVRSFDPRALFAHLGFDRLEGNKGVDARAKALQGAKPLVDIYRVSPDILVVATPPRAEIYGRCPAD